MELNDREKIVETQEQELETSSVEIAEQVAEAYDEAEQVYDPTAPFPLSCGAIVRAKALPEVFAQTLLKKIPRPRPPKIRIVDEEDGRERWEENPNDPSYIREEREWQTNIIEATLDLALLRGVEVIKLPEGMPSFDKDEEFAEEMEIFGFDLGEMSRTKRRLLWMKYRLFNTEEDISAITNRSEELSGISEELVQEQMDLFRSEGGRDLSDGLATG
jgi:hypothetical protein